MRLRKIDNLRGPVQVISEYRNAPLQEQTTTETVAISFPERENKFKFQKKLIQKEWHSKNSTKNISSL